MRRIRGYIGARRDKTSNSGPDAETMELARTIDGLSLAGLRGVLKNILMVADLHRDEDTAVAVARQIRAHAEYEAHLSPYAMECRNERETTV